MILLGFYAFAMFVWSFVFGALFSPPVDALGLLLLVLLSESIHGVFHPISTDAPRGWAIRTKQTLAFLLINCSGYLAYRLVHQFISSGGAVLNIWAFVVVVFTLVAIKWFAAKVL